MQRQTDNRNSGAQEIVAPPEALGKYRDALEEGMKALLPREPASLYQMLRYHLGWIDAEGRPLPGRSGGKALRPTLCFLTCETLGCDWPKATTVAATLELIHNFSLIHDDIQDGDQERRGRSTAWSIWGVGKALWAGNAMRVLSDYALDADDLTLAKRAQAAELLTKAYLEMIEGQYMDLAFEAQTDVTVEDYLAMIARKTGALIRCAVELGALVATDDADMIGTLTRWGTHIGLAFQVRDDMLGIWGDPKKTGKAIGNDIRRKKKTFPVVYGFENAKGRELQALRDVYALGELDERDVQSVLGVLARVQAHKQAQALVDTHTEYALSVLHRLEEFAAPGSYQQMIDLTTYLAHRDH